MSILCPNYHVNAEPARASINDALAFIRTMNDTAHAAGYFLAPFGSVLTGVGCDIDIVAVPRGERSDYVGLINAICKRGFKEVGPRHRAGSNCEVLLRPKWWRIGCPVVDLHIREIT